MIRVTVGSGDSGEGGYLVLSAGGTTTASGTTGGKVSITSGVSATEGSGDILITTPNAGTDATPNPDTGGVTGKIVLSSGASTQGNSGALYIGTGAADSGRSGTISMTVGSGDSGSGGDLVLSAGPTTAASKIGGKVLVGAGSGATHGTVQVNVGSTGTFEAYGDVSGSTDPVMRFSGADDFYLGGVTLANTPVANLDVFSTGTIDVESTSTLGLKSDVITLTANTDAASEINILSADGVHITGGLTIYSGGLWVEGQVTVTNGIISTVGITTSDERLKTDIVPLPNPLSKVTKLRGVYFSWVKDEPGGLKFDDRRHVGVLAQDVQEVLPEIVDEINGGKYLGVDYPALIPLLIEAIRELDRTNAMMTAFEALEAQVRSAQPVV